MSRLNLLRTFLAVYRAESISGAAKTLNLTQPAVTKQMQQLEAQLKRALFLRLPRSIVPTPAADELARRVADHLDALEITLEATKIGANDLAGTVYIGGPSEFLGAKLLPALSDLHAQNVQLRVLLGQPEELLEDLRGGALDLMVSTVRVASRGLEVTPLYLEELVLIGSAAWAKRLPARALETRGVALLDGIPLLAYAEELPLVRRYWRKVFGRALAGQASIVVPDLRAIAQAVSAGAGITVLPRYLVEGMLERSEVIQLLEPKQPPVNQLWLVARPGPRSQPRVEFVKAQIARASSAWGTNRGEV
jgi:DNA-binding transcriptional LysR family regulator